MAINVGKSDLLMFDHAVALDDGHLLPGLICQH
jgi:hypothetical protein